MDSLVAPDAGAQNLDAVGGRAGQHPDQARRVAAQLLAQRITPAQALNPSGAEREALTTSTAAARAPGPPSQRMFILTKVEAGHLGAQVFLQHQSEYLVVKIYDYKYGV